MNSLYSKRRARCQQVPGGVLLLKVQTFPRELGFGYRFLGKSWTDSKSGLLLASISEAIMMVLSENKNSSMEFISRASVKAKISGAAVLSASVVQLLAIRSWIWQVNFGSEVISFDIYVLNFTWPSLKSPLLYILPLRRA